VSGRRGDLKYLGAAQRSGVVVQADAGEVHRYLLTNETPARLIAGGVSLD
jgi:hypothetical protein